MKPHLQEMQRPQKAILSLKYGNQGIHMSYTEKHMPIQDRIQFIIYMIRKIGKPINDLAQQAHFDATHLYNWKYIIQHDLFDEYIEPHDASKWLDLLKNEYALQFNETLNFFVDRNPNCIHYMKKENREQVSRSNITYLQNILRRGTKGTC